VGDDAGKSLPAHLSDPGSVIQAKFAALLNSFFELIEMLGVSDVRGGCPFGVRLQPQKYQKHERNDAKREHSTYFRFTRMTNQSTSNLLVAREGTG
jgi:hypothetical protein